MEDKLKALANDILEQCQQQGLTFSEMRTLSAMLHVKWDEARDRAMEKAGDYRLRLNFFEFSQCGIKCSGGHGIVG